MKEFMTDAPAIVNHTIVVICENDDRHHFKPSIVNDGPMMTALMRDIARFFLLGKVKGRYINIAYPTEANMDKQGVFAKTAREAGKQIIKMCQYANEEDRAGITESLPVLKYIDQFNYDDVRESMVALQIMGHNEDAIFFMFMHLMTCEEWP